MRLTISFGFLMMAAVCFAQTWEVGASAGAGFASAVNGANATGSASAGFVGGQVFGASVGQDRGRRLGGEIRYLYRASDLRLSSAGTTITFGGQAHLIYYDVLCYPVPARSRLRPFVAAGAGAKIFRGTGKENAYQPLYEYALLTKTREVKPVVCFGAGIKYKLTPRLQLRADIYDYASPFPTQVIAPAEGANLSGWLHDLVPTVGVGIAF